MPQSSSNDAMYGLPLWKYLPVYCSPVFTNLVRHKDFLFNKIGKIVDDTLEDIRKADKDGEEGEDLSILRQLLRNPGVNEVAKMKGLGWPCDFRHVSHLSPASASIRTIILPTELEVQDVKASVVDYITAGVDTIGNSIIFALALVAGDARVRLALQVEKSTNIRMTSETNE